MELEPIASALPARERRRKDRRVRPQSETGGERARHDRATEKRDRDGPPRERIRVGRDDEDLVPAEDGSALPERAPGMDRRHAGGREGRLRDELLRPPEDERRGLARHAAQEGREEVRTVERSRRDDRAPAVRQSGPEVHGSHQLDDSRDLAVLREGSPYELGERTPPVRERSRRDPSPGAGLDARADGLEVLLRRLELPGESPGRELAGQASELERELAGKGTEEKRRCPDAGARRARALPLPRRSSRRSRGPGSDLQGGLRGATDRAPRDGARHDRPAALELARGHVDPVEA